MTFSKCDSKLLNSILKHRRDVRGNRFLDKKIAKKKIKKILKAGLHAPSVGYSQPWKFVVIESKKKRKKIYKNFKKEFKKSKKHFKNPLYTKLKLEGILEAPLNIAVFYKKESKKILGQTSQKKMGEYSVVCAVQNMWLMARSLNIGIGWVSILNPKRVKKIVDAPKEYKLVAYLCVGYTDEFLDEPELKKLKWEKKKSLKEVVLWS
jgi:5,6-dimethylbenzimidazole synthase